MSAIRARRPKALLVGDSLDDAAMAAGDDEVMRVRILDPRSDEAPNKEEMRKTFGKFDAIIEVGTLQPLIQLVEYMKS